MTTLQELAIEAAQSASDAFGVGYEPPAQDAFDFMKNLWYESEDPRYEEIGDFTPEFEMLYDQALANGGTK